MFFEHLIQLNSVADTLSDFTRCLVWFCSMCIVQKQKKSTECLFVDKCEPEHDVFSVNSRR